MCFLSLVTNLLVVSRKYCEYEHSSTRYTHDGQVRFFSHRFAEESSSGTRPDRMVGWYFPWGQLVCDYKNEYAWLRVVDSRLCRSLGRRRRRRQAVCVCATDPSTAARSLAAFPRVKLLPRPSAACASDACGWATRNVPTSSKQQSRQPAVVFNSPTFIRARIRARFRSCTYLRTVHWRGSCSVHSGYSRDSRSASNFAAKTLRKVEWN